MEDHHSSDFTIMYFDITDNSPKSPLQSPEVVTSEGTDFPVNHVEVRAALIVHVNARLNTLQAVHSYTESNLFRLASSCYLKTVVNHRVL